MLQTVRLYRMHDLDLYLLYYTHNFMFYDALREALHIYADNRDGYISTPAILDPLPDMTGKGIINIRVRLDEVKDAQIIELLKKIEPGRRNMFIKMTLRRYLKDLDEKVYPTMGTEWNYTGEHDSTMIKIENSTNNENLKKTMFFTPKKEGKVKEPETIPISDVVKTIKGIDKDTEPQDFAVDKEDMIKNTQESQFEESTNGSENGDLFDMISQFSY